MIFIGMAKPVDEQEECLKLVGLGCDNGNEAFLTRLTLRLGFTSCLVDGKKDENPTDLCPTTFRHCLSFWRNNEAGKPA